MTDGSHQQLIAFAQIVMIDVALAGDNAIVVAMAASRVAVASRTKVIFWGTAGAVVLRILFALLATQLFAIIGLTLAGGILLLGVCWKMYREFTRGRRHPAFAAQPSSTRFRNAVTQIIIADLSMSLDNVLAVAGAAKGDLTVLIAGLALSIVLMGVAANFIATLLARYPWVSWLGLAIILYVALEMIWRGVHEVVHV